MDTKLTIPHFTGINLRIKMKKRNGDAVSHGEVVCTIEFDVVTSGPAEAELEAYSNGRITWLIEDNAEVDFGQEIAIIES